MATIERRGKSWYLQWSENRQQRRVSLGKINKSEAQAYLRKKEIELSRRKGVSIAGPAFSLFVQDYLEWHSREYPSSYPRIESITRVHLSPYFGYTPIGAIEKQSVEHYKRERTAKPGTVAKELRTLQAIVNKAVDWDIIPSNQIRGVRPPQDLSSKPPRWYTVEELEAIYSSSPDSGHIWKLMANTGLRRAEAFNLKANNILDDRIVILSADTGRTKSRKWREVPISPGAREALGDFPKSGYLLPRMKPFSLSRKFSKILQRIDLDGSLHCLRHSFCSHLVMKGIPLRTVQLLAGHANYSTTEKYTHLAPDHLAGAVDGLDI